MFNDFWETINYEPWICRVHDRDLELHERCKWSADYSWLPWHREGLPVAMAKNVPLISFQRIIQSSFHWTKSPGRQVNQEPMKFHPFYTGWLETGFLKGSMCIYSMKSCIIPNVPGKKIIWSPNMEVWKMMIRLSIGWFLGYKLVWRVFST